MHTWTTSLTKGAIQKAYPSLGTLKRVLVTQRDGNGDWYGRVEQMKLDGSKADVTADRRHVPVEVRAALELVPLRLRLDPRPRADPGPGHAGHPDPPRWLAIGGASSVVGRQKGAEYAVAGGRAQRFAKGRIFYKAGLGAHEEFGRVLKVYVRRGAATSKLGFPLTRPQRAGKRVKARFEHGTISVRRHGKPRAIVTFTS